jgi:hypothetical protein
VLERVTELVVHATKRLLPDKASALGV